MVKKVHDVLEDIRDMKRAQHDIAEQMSQIRQENDHLFDDVSWIQEKVHQQQNILDKVQSLHGDTTPNMSIDLMGPMSLVLWHVSDCLELTPGFSCRC